MEFIYTNQKIDKTEFASFLKQLFPSLSIFYWDFISEPPFSFDSNNPQHIVFNSEFDSEKLEFGFQLCICRTPEENAEERALYIAENLSRTFNIKVLVPFTDLNNKNYPYLDILFENGKTYLADDCDTSFADNSEGLIKIIKEYNIPSYKFDTQGNKIK